MFDRNLYLAKIEPGHIVNDTGIANTIAHAGTIYDVALLHYLTPSENEGRQNIYVDVLGADGKPLLRPAALRVGWTWQGRHSDEPAPPAIFEKLPPEPGANIAIFGGQVVTLWIENPYGVRLSDEVVGLHTLLPGDGAGNRGGHNSFYVVFRQRAQPVTLPPVTDDRGRRALAALAAIRAILDGVGDVL